jgi:oligogalacturonate-specific porin family protein
MKTQIAFALLAVTAVAQAATIDTRLSYDSVAEDYTARILVSNTWANGFGASLEAPITLTSTKYSGQMDTLRTGTTEIVASYTYRFSPEMFIRPGLSTLVSSAGSTSRPFVTLGYKLSDTWDASVRYRYGHRNYDTLDLSNKLDRDDAHNLTLWAGYKLNSSVNLEYQLDYIKKVNNYFNDNKKTHIFENEFVAVFPDGFGKGITPYVLIDHLGTSYGTANKQATTHWRPRVGLKISF